MSGIRRFLTIFIRLGFRVRVCHYRKCRERTSCMLMFWVNMVHGRLVDVWLQRYRRWRRGFNGRMRYGG